MPKRASGNCVHSVTSTSGEGEDTVEMERRRGRERFVDTRGDGREIHRARRVHFSRFHRFRFIINDPRHRGSRRVAVDAFTAREIDHSCSALGPFVRHCSMMSPVYAWEGGGEREGVG